MIELGLAEREGVGPGTSGPGMKEQGTTGQETTGQMTLGRSAAGSQLRRLGVALHDLCQPLTTLQCRLEMAELIGTAEAHREAVEAGRTECARLSAAVRSMREMLRAANQDATEG